MSSGSPEPWRQFPGDEAIGLEAYGELIDTPYTPLASTMVEVAKVFALPIGPETTERLRRMSAAMYHMDALLDESEDPTVGRQLYFEILDYGFEPYYYSPEQSNLDPTIRQHVDIVQNALFGLSQENRDSLLNRTQQLGEFSQVKRDIRDGKQYVKILKAEADLTAEIMLSIFNDAEKAHPNFQPFCQWMSRAITVAVMADSLDDLKDDVQTGITVVESGVTNHLRIAAAALPDLWPLIRNRRGRDTLRLMKRVVLAERAKSQSRKRELEVTKS